MFGKTLLNLSASAMLGIAVIMPNVAVAFGAPPLSAQATPAADRASDEGRRACTPDVFRLCSEFIPDATQITICLQQRVRFLSPECRAVFTSPDRQ